MEIARASVLLVFMFTTETWSLTFLETPKPYGAKVGGTAHFNCNLQCVPGTDQCTGLTWTERVSSNDGSEIDIYYSDTGTFNSNNPNRMRYSIEPGTTNLRISNVNVNDAGRYTCKPNRGGSDSDSKFAYLTVFEPLTCQSNGIAVENGMASLTCDVRFHKTADPEDDRTPSLTWNIPGQTGGSNPDHATMTANFTVFREQNGSSYTCTTYYSSGLPTYTDTCNATIDVQYHPRNINITTNSVQGFSRMLPGDRLTCTADGNPPPTIRWHKLAGQPGTNSIEFGPDLVVTAAMEGENTYRCEASNVLANQQTMAISKNITFTVFVPTTTTIATTTPSTPVPESSTTSVPTETSSVNGGGNLGPSNQQPDHTAAIAGGVAGGVVAIIAIVVIVVVVLRRKKSGSPPIDGDEEKQPGPPQSNPTMHHPDVIRPASKYNTNEDDPRFRNVENLQYADLALDDTPRSRKPIQVYDIGSDTQYAEIQHGKPTY